MQQAATKQPVYARLPDAPITASPVPHLTSLYHFNSPHDGGSRSYPGNCGGKLIKDLLLYFKPKNVFDVFSGSGTCKDVCREMNIPYAAIDIRYGQDACSASSYPLATKYDFVWSHPPYWRMKVYTSDHRDLSQQPTLKAFLDRYAQFISNSASILSQGGNLAVLMGDYSDREAGFVPLVFYTKLLAFRAGLRQHCTDIVRFSHGASSGKKVYHSSFIPGLHDVCMIFTKAK